MSRSRNHRNPDVHIQVSQQKLTQFLVRTTEADKDKLNLFIASHFYSCGTPFRHSENLYLKKIISDLRSGYTSPNRRNLANKLLDKIYITTQEEAKNKLNGKSVTLIQDGWSGIHNEPVSASCVSDGKKFFFFVIKRNWFQSKNDKYCLDLAVKDIMEATGSDVL